MPDYLVHQSRERARFRHEFFNNEHSLKEALLLLKKEKGIAGLKPGRGSVLLLIEPEADIPGICARLEERFPQLRDAPRQDDAMPAARAASHKPPSARKRLLHVYLGSGIATVGLALAGLGHMHALAGGIFTILGINHVWTRRKAL